MRVFFILCSMARTAMRESSTVNASLRWQLAKPCFWKPGVVSNRTFPIRDNFVNQKNYFRNLPLTKRDPLRI
jgi:hypothetical protein